MTPREWVRANVVPALLIVTLIVFAAIVGFNLWRSGQTADTRATLSNNQAAASLASGRDAVTTVGNRMDAEARLDEQTRKNNDDIRQVPGAAATVAPADRDAFLRILCRSANRRRDPKCLQLADPR